MENIVINFEVNNKDLITTLELLQKTGQITAADAEKFKTLGQASQQAVKNIQTPITQLNKEVKDLGQNVSKAFVLDTSNTVAKNINNFRSIRSEIKQATADAIELGRKFGELSPQAIEAQKRVAKLKDEFGDTQKRIDALNPDAKFRAFSQTLGGLTGIFAGLTGAIQLFGGSTKEAEEIAKKFQGALNLAQGLNALGELGDSLKNIKALLGVTTTATVAQTTATEGLAVATTADAVATEGATVATKSFTAALLTNPITIAVAAIAALAGAYFLLKDNAEDATAEVDKLFATLDKSTDAVNENKKFAEQALKNRIDLLKAQGKTEQEIITLETDAQKQRRDFSATEIVSRQKNIEALKEEQKQLILKRAAGTITSEERDAEFKRIEERIKAEQKAAKDQVLIIADANAQIEIIETAFSTKKKEKSKKDAKELSDQAIKDAEELAKQKTDIAKRAGDEEFAFQMSLLDGQQAIELAQYDLNEQEKLAIQIKYAEKRKELIFNTGYDKNALQKANDEIALLQAKLNAQIKKDAADTNNAVAAQSKETTEKSTKEFTAAEIKKREEAAATLEYIASMAQQIAAVFTGLSDARISELEDQRDAVAEADSAEIVALKDKLDKRLISQKTYEIELKKLEDKKQADTKKFEAQITEEKRKQAILNKELALFNIAINTAVAITKLPSEGGLLGIAAIPLMIALGVAQAAAVLAAPLPKFHKGRLAQLDSGEQHAIIRKDETIFDPVQSKEFAPTFAAIYNGKIKPNVINDYVSLKLKGGNVSSTIDTHRLAYDIAFAMRDQNKVYVKNMPELAKAIADNLPKPDPRKW